MCGLAGVFHFNDDRPVDETILRKMCGSLRHRGPDGEGVFIDAGKRLGLGHRRLSIIDLEGGAQPMSSGDSGVWIVFNGEIYNFPELKKELEAKGRFFRTRSDTEVILRMYEEYGAAAFGRLNGIFAFALYDERKRVLFLARDPFGVKPIYYHLGSQRLVFASETKAIFQDPSIAKELDRAALDTFLTLRYNPSPDTLFGGIKKLPPQHCLEMRFGASAPQIRSYEGRLPSQRSIGEAEAIAEYRRLLESAVKRQLLSDVPVGLFLSGGVDSAAIGHLMRKHSPSKIKTFSIGFEGRGDYNELADARATAQLIGSEHREITMRRREYFDHFCRSFEALEEPIAETTVPALHCLAAFASKELKVVLAGQGADEPLAGYARYRGAQLIGRYARILEKLPLAGLAGILPRNERLKRAAFALSQKGELARILGVYTIFYPSEKRLLLKDPSFAGGARAAVERLYANTRNLPDMLSKMLYIDTRLGLPDDLLLFNDKVTMASSLEMRVPFLDAELVAFLESLPVSLKLKGRVGKYIHKKAVETWLPPEIVRRKKRGFETPVDEWLRQGLAGAAKKLLNAGGSAGSRFFDLGFVSGLIERHRRGSENNERRIFALMCFEMWYKTCFEGKTVDPGIFEE